MTVSRLPGIPGGSALVPALDMFIADVLLEARAARITASPQDEVCGAFIYRHLEPSLGENGVEWKGEIDWVRLENVAATPTNTFQIRSAELQHHVEQELETLKRLCEGHASTGQLPSEAGLFMAGFSPLVGIGHSHPGGTTAVTAADYRMSENAATWRRAAAPQTIMGKDSEAQYFEADFLFAIHDVSRGNGTLVHFRKGLVHGEWKGDFLPRVD